MIEKGFRNRKWTFIGWGKYDLNPNLVARKSI
jgi:hypothetical protein